MHILDRLVLNPRLDLTLAQQLNQQLHWYIASGQIQPGEMLPSVRQVAKRFHIHVNTVRSAYQKLAEAGLVETRQGLGTCVLAGEPGQMRQSAHNLPSHTVGVILPSITNPFYHPYLQGIETVANQNRTLLFLCLTHDDPDLVFRNYIQLLARNVDGILITSQDSSSFMEARHIQATQGSQPAPLVTVDWPTSQGYAVNLDLEQAGYLATRHLIEHGHRRIGLVTYALEAPNVTPVNAGYRRALTEAGLPFEVRLVQPVLGFTTTAGAEGAQPLLAMEQPPTAIFAISDLLAIGVLHALKQAGRRIPEDMAVVGFNDIPLAAEVSPALTTVAAPVYQMGLEAMQMLQSLIAGKTPARSQIVLPTTLAIRQSCGAHPAP